MIKSRWIVWVGICGIIYLLTYVRSWALPEKLPILQPFKKFPAILGNPKVHYRVHKSPPLVPIWASSIQSIPSHPTSPRSIIILSTHLRLGLPSGLLVLAFPPISYMHSSSPPFVLHALPISCKGEIRFTYKTLAWNLKKETACKISCQMRG
jgi:hypothetical protein